MKKLNSITGKVVSLVSVSMIVVVCIVMLIVIPKAKSNLSKLTEDYMVDLAKITGDEIDTIKAERGSAVALNASTLGRIVGDIAVRNISSSYTYIVSGDGTMLYHPTPEKIGQPVENDAVKQIVSQIEQGEIPEPDLIKYDFKGVKKFASYYVDSSASFIVVVTADEHEIFAGMGEITIIGIVVAVCVLIFYIFITALFAIKIVKPITVLNQEIKKMSGLDFTKNPDLEKYTARGDESGEISTSVIELETKLEEFMAEVKDMADRVYAASDNMTQSVVDSIETMSQVETATNEVATGAGNQADETQKATEHVITMGNMIVDTTNDVDELRSTSKEMNSAGDDAVQILTQLSAINDKTRESVELVSKQTTVTNDCVTDIRAAVEMITEIASETNLLSLNASIEAARAGEAGRGFAVVAAEIQKLAEQSNTSAKQIEEIITKITQESEKSVAIMGEIKGIIEQQNQDVLATQESFKKVKTGIASSLQGIQNITDRTEQLDAARVQVVDIVSDLSAIAEENAASTEETLACATEANAIIRKIGKEAQNVNSIAIDLKKNIDTIKI
ncbi:MAG: methyl-accepting chemotaxis protein [Lachnospiraceae bacterium]|nr:methyl-accepting chemotaxis protein [Lachnospiraceae bacterium]